MYELISGRRTVRKFTREPIPDELLRKYVDAARLAPSGANLQPLKYVIVKSEAVVAEVTKNVRWAAYIAPEGNPKKDEEPTAYIAVAADTDIKKSGWEADVGAAVMSLLLAAEEDGVGCCWMQAINYEEISRILQLPKNLRLCCVVALGKKAEQPVSVTAKNGEIKYYKDENGVLKVPKRPLEEILTEI